MRLRRGCPLADGRDRSGQPARVLRLEHTRHAALRRHRPADQDAARRPLAPPAPRNTAPRLRMRPVETVSSVCAILRGSLTRAPLPLIRYYLHHLLRCVVVLQVKPPNSKRTLPRRWKRVRAASWMATTRHRKKRRCTSACLPRRRSRLFARSGAWRGRPGNSGGPEKPSSSRAGAAGSRSANDGDGSTTSRW